MDLYWLEQREKDVPEENDWLSAGEMLFFEGLRFAKRRADWRLGRWTAKRAVSICLGSPAFHSSLASMEVRSAASGVPEVFIADAPAPVTISLSHRNGRALCVVTAAGADLGCDLELIEARSDAFVADYFTAEEQAFVARQPAAERAHILALLWSAKESALKALHAGLRLDTRSVRVDLLDTYSSGGIWRPLQVVHSAGRLFHGWWQNADGMVRTIVAAPAPGLPIHLESGDSHDRASLLPWSGPLPAAQRSSTLPIVR